ncbi:hypothetical protein HYU21_00585 [Candidatus Woesearchaeota archaeon]|nr:hypothetical protein [Candidatus Woesearchaeota archaeon]
MKVDLKLRKRSLGLIFLLVLSLFILSSLSFSAMALSTVVVTPLKNEITTSEKALFKVEITNLEDKSQRYSLYSLQSGQGWNVDPTPLKDRIVDLDSKKNYTTRINVEPLEEYSPGIYYVNLLIESESGERYNEALKMYLRPDEPPSYLPTLKATADLNDKINPREMQSIKLFLENRNPLDLSGLTVKVQSDMPEFVKEVVVDLAPLEKKTVEFSMLPNPYQEPRDYTLFFVFEKDGQTIKVVEQEVEVVVVESKFTTEVNTERKLLQEFTKVTVKNEGNVLSEQEVKIPVSKWKSFISSGAMIFKYETTKSETNKNEEKQNYAVWNLKLEAGESKTLQVMTNYRWLLYFALAILFLAAFYFYARTSASLTKTAVATKIDEEGALSEVKVTLEIKNYAQSKLHSVEIVDLLPGIANIEKNQEAGTLSPQQVEYTKQGTKVKWSIAELEPTEQRIISYKAKAKLDVLGTISLPRASIEYKKGKSKRLKKAYSNIFRLG